MERGGCPTDAGIYLANVEYFQCRGFLKPEGCFWLPPAYFWLLLAAFSHFWALLAAFGHFWQLLGDFLVLFFGHNWLFRPFLAISQCFSLLPAACCCFLLGCCLPFAPFCCFWPIFFHFGCSLLLWPFLSCLWCFRTCFRTPAG